MFHNIEAERGRKQFTKEDMAKALGISSKTYLSYIRGERPIPSDKLLKMAHLFHCSTDYLLDMDKDSLFTRAEPPGAGGGGRG